MRIFLVRHGQSMGNVDQSVHLTTADHAIPLSDRGKEQATGAGEFLRDFYKDLPSVPDYAAMRESYGDVMRFKPQRPRVWTSPYLRTRQTADGICEAMGKHVLDRREHILLCEQQFGLFDGIPDEELPVKYPDEHAHYKKQEEFEGRFWARMPLGESRFDVATRVHQAFGTFHRDAKRHGVNDLVVVCHGVTMRAFLMMWLHHTPEWFEAEKNPKNCSIRLIEDSEDQGYVYEGF